MRRVIAILYFLIISHQFIMSQTAEREILSSAGGSYTGNIAVDWTLGQVVIQQGGSSNAIFTQGFQQPTIVQASNVSFVINRSPFRSIPNPSEGSASLQWDKMPEDAAIVVYNAAGSKIYEHIWPKGSIHELPSHYWQPGVFHITIECAGKWHSLKHVRL